MSTEEKQSSKNEGPQFTLPDPATAYEKASAAFQGAAWLNDSQYKQSDEVLAAALAINETVEKQRIAAEKASFDEQKRGMISQLDADIAYAPDEETRNKLRDIRDQVRDAKFGDSIAAIMANAKTATTAATSKADGDGGVDLNKLHQDLYKNDAKYREEVNKTLEESKKDTSDFDAKQAILDKLAKDKGYTTNVDNKRDEIEADIKKLENNPLQADKLLELRIERLRIIEQQRKEIERQAKAKGDTETAKSFEDHKPVIEEQRKLQLEHLKKLQEDLLKAMERKWKEAGESQERITERKNDLNQKFGENRKAFENSATSGYEEAIQDVKKQLDEVSKKPKPEVAIDKPLEAIAAMPILEARMEKTEVHPVKAEPAPPSVKLDYKDEAHDPEKGQSSAIPVKPGSLNLGL